MAIKIYPYKQGSRGARALADAIGGRVLRTEGSRYRYRNQDTIINWGSQNPHPNTTMNPGRAVAKAANKLEAFLEMEDYVSIPRFWTNQRDIPEDAFPIVCRTILNGHSGAGIVIAETRDDLVQAPLYVQYVKKQDEYRVHVVQGNVIAVQQKRRRHDVERPNWQVRNHANGFVFAREGVNPPQMVLDEAIKAIEALGLDFGAVDVIYNDRSRTAYVLEVNTAPGLEGETVNDYVRAFQRIAR